MADEGILLIGILFLSISKFTFFHELSFDYFKPLSKINGLFFNNFSLCTSKIGRMLDENLQKNLLT